MLKIEPGKMRPSRNSKVTQSVFDELRGDDLSIFPIGQLRLRSVWYLVVISTLYTSGYARSVNQKILCDTGC